MAKQVSRRELLRNRAKTPEKSDPRPVEVPSFVRQGNPDNLRDMLQQMVRNEISRAAVNAGEGSFEDEDDFELEEREPPLTSVYEVIEMDSETIESLDGTPQPDSDKQLEPETPIPDNPSDGEPESDK